jgi:hypothetical protein
VHAAAAPESSVQLNVDPGLLEVKLKFAVVWLVGFAGFDVIVTTGRTVSRTVVVVLLNSVLDVSPIL